jgi:hypothetical protein
MPRRVADHRWPLEFTKESVAMCRLRSNLSPADSRPSGRNKRLLNQQLLVSRGYKSAGRFYSDEKPPVFSRISSSVLKRAYVTNLSLTLHF